MVADELDLRHLDHLLHLRDDVRDLDDLLHVLDLDDALLADDVRELDDLLHVLDLDLGHFLVN
eukprot:3891837-Heterocapsa_arctica.AAC.1